MNRTADYYKTMRSDYPADHYVRQALDEQRAQQLNDYARDDRAGDYAADSEVA